MAKTYYAEELTAIPFGTMAKSLSTQMPALLAYPIAAVFRLRGMIGWTLSPTYGVGNIGSETVVTREALPPRALSKLAGVFEVLGDMGFQPLKFAIADVIGEKEHVASLFLDADGGTLATVEWMRMRGAEGIEETTPVEFNSYFDGDPDVMTGWMPKEHIVLSEMLKIDFVDLNCVANVQPLRAAYESHRRYCVGRPAELRMTAEAALAEHDRRSRRRFDWVLERGLLRPMKISEIERVKRLSLPEPARASKLLQR